MCIRDRTCDTIARLGGDEFAVLIENVLSFDDLVELAKRMIETLRIPFDLNDGDVLVTASIGIVIDVGDQDVDELLSNADKAMYVAKSRGKQCYEFWLNQTSLESHAMSSGPIRCKGTPPPKHWIS